MDSRLQKVKDFPRAFRFYVLTLYEIIKESKPRNVIEIGTQKGQSTKSILLAMGENKYGKLISIDHKNRSTILDAEFSDLKTYWDFIQGNSHLEEVFNKTKKELNGELADILFLDGDHKMPGVGQDFDEYTKLLKPGGILIMHDIYNSNEEVSVKWNSITWEKFGFNYGLANGKILVGLGIAKKPLN
jgi:predicted O-methyltransferase YrrM